MFTHSPITHVILSVLENCTLESSVMDKDVPSVGSSAASYCLKLPGKNLYLTPLLKAKRFRTFGYKTGAFNELQVAKLGILEEIGAGKGSKTVSYITNRTIL